jgi:hypothetical protein
MTLPLGRANRILMRYQEKSCAARMAAHFSYGRIPDAPLALESQGGGETTTIDHS